ncbi:CCA tRNA nucleotidyltransferase [Leuconostoc citreum]|uniref:CCA-adding enzyme n=1 Tax=Leuconostoc citreum (strain KM20) TaxID=349519 RepID=CCA_LEUCK|nr:CCA tRNA nucleotidyltransferase [Leuconostoc citreum]B1MYC1.1 RecName: Full=CCA-adding enzyme; AltName: Full=CCA tRNA nucleotidyltransferase; AltName: Full=tRNA CCA-pyrophosphorylase; AltName: Full=tRNA adenylyl-/cytidylyl- transferase; AltName: Full=tRNA nucleotidyltransferase; AltName: Full=tRNA-NT [Leuconostoc citreum KM20]ACA82523.1 tRNA nucleotidyltransferase/poly(A) polymerase [Leuconostoc citreum KM20]MCS8584129.1 CCA tRNA nucleotidyltransferase [Leuconostoc citreum]MCS8600506.1 CCA t
MKISTLPQEFMQAQPILEHIESAGFEAYFVGGAVRDMLLNKPIHDVDIATSAFPEEIKALFTKTVDTGIQHGTVMVLDHGDGYEITTFRTESTYTDFRRPDKVTFVRSLAEDLKRRDFTINAIAMTKDGDIIDLFDGLTDMAQKRIRAVGDAEVRFNEDALRIMRALRFSAQLGFDIAPHTKAALKQIGRNLEKIAVERIRVEFEKLLMGQYASNSLSVAIEADLIRYLPGHIKKEDWLTITADLKRNQPQARTVIWPYFLSRLSLRLNELQLFMRSWKTSREDMRAVLSIVPIVKHVQTVSVFELYAIYDYQALLFEVLTLIGTPLATQQRVKQIFDALPITHNRDMCISGGDLLANNIVTPGPQMGRILTQLEHAVIQRIISNRPDSLLEYAKELVDNEKN